MQSIKGQLTVRGILIGSAGCVVITAASAYTALKMGALPWPIVFAAIVSLFFLKALGRGKASLNEANVTHTVMSAGAMVAGGLAFTIPGIWMLGHADDVGVFEMLFVALSGVVLGLMCTAVLRRHFIEDAGLEYPIGEAAAQTLVAGNAGGKTGWKLFGSRCRGAQRPGDRAPRSPTGSVSRPPDGRRCPPRARTPPGQAWPRPRCRAGRSGRPPVSCRRRWTRTGTTRRACRSAARAPSAGCGPRGRAGS